MNIVYLHSHDTGRCIQPCGEAVSTPALQSLADAGTVFTGAYSAAPTCSPSRAALLTGQSAHGAGMVALAHRGGVLKHPERHLANYLRAQGFLTVKAGVSHVGPADTEHGYLEVVNTSHDGKNITAAACGFLDRPHAGRPFFLDAGFFETHRRGPGGKGFSHDRQSPGDGDGDPGDCDPPGFLGDHPDVKRDWRDLYNAVERLDGYYSRILSKLEERGLADDTLVIATTDHGVPFPDMKCSLTARGTGVLLILRFPRIGSGVPGAGRRCPALVSHLDVFPTICDLLGSPVPGWLEGKSLLPLLREAGPSEIHDALFSEVTFHAAFEPKRSVRTKQWNYIRNFAAPHPPVMPNCDDGLTKRHWMDTGRYDREIPPEELYDLRTDPMELNNLAGDSACAEVREELREKLAGWMERTGDPLLNPDPGVLPEGLLVNTWDQPHPGPGPLQSEWDPRDWSKIQPR